MRAHCIRKVGLREADKLRVWKCYGSSCAGRRPQWLHRKIKKAIVVRKYWATDREIHVVGMKWFVRGSDEMLAREHPLVVEVILSRTVELVRSRPRGEHGLQAGGAAVLTAECVYLNAGFLDGCRLGSQVQNALTNSAGHIQAVDHILIVVLSLTICAGIDLLPCGEIVDPRSWAARTARSESRNSRRQRHKRDQVTADDGQLCHGLVLKCELGSTVSSIN